MRWPNAKPPRPPRESAKGIDLWGLGLASGCGLGDWILWPGEWGYAIGGLPVDRLTLAHHRRWPAWRAGLRARAGLLDAGGAAKSNHRRRVQVLRRFPPARQGSLLRLPRHWLLPLVVDWLARRSTGRQRTKRPLSAAARLLFLPTRGA
jgi:hypothetical protein